jgi:hypothetical protein
MELCESLAGRSSLVSPLEALDAAQPGAGPRVPSEALLQALWCPAGPIEKRRPEGILIV